MAKIGRVAGLVLALPVWALIHFLGGLVLALMWVGDGLWDRWDTWRGR